METLDQKIFNHIVKLLKLEDALKGIVINGFTTLNVLFSKSNLECTKIDMSITIGLNFDVDLEFFLLHNAGEIVKLNISVQNPDIRNEIRSYTNYLQRQKDIKLCLFILKKFATAIGERQLIIDMLKLHSVVNIINKLHIDGGVGIVCRVGGAKYLESHWKVQFDCTTHSVMDQIDFSVTKKDAVFYKSVKKNMMELVSPNLPYPIKVKYWWTILEAFKIKNDDPVLEIIESDDSHDFILVQNHTIDTNEVTEQYEIVESLDDDDCFIVKK